jgi:hypothetical protein
MSVFTKAKKMFEMKFTQKHQLLEGKKHKESSETIALIIIMFH